MDQEFTQRPVQILATHDAGGGNHVVRATDVPEYPAIEWGVIIGDVIHNLRSALDHLAWQLTHWGGRTPPDSLLVQFPIFDDPAAFSSSRRVEQFEKDHQAVLEEFQPYQGVRGGDNYSGPFIHPLALLRDLSNVDKHQLITSIETASREFRFSPPKVSGQELPSPAEGLPELVRFDLEGFPEGPRPVEVGAALMYVRVFPAALRESVEIEGVMKPTVHLAEGPRPLFPALDRITAFTEGILDVFAQGPPPLSTLPINLGTIRGSP